MDIHEEYTIEDIFRDHPGVFDSGKDFVEDLSGNDTMVYRDEILTGKAKETYEDEPYLIPYIVQGSDRCVIICPGGAYLSKSMENEGEDVASFLNKAGISCFVLWYRSYPYRAPVMFRDCQRAIRYVRYHAKDYNINPDKIGIVGFSAGGNLCGTTVQIYRNTCVEAEGYIPDDIDFVSAHVNALAMIYPAITFEDSQVFLECIEEKDLVRDPATRAKLAQHYTLKNHIKKNDPPTFLCSAIDDSLIPPLQICEYAQVLKRNDVPVELHIFDKGGHGFGGCNPARVNPMFPNDYTRVDHWKDLFSSWINTLFS
jgi:acetyl esterase/lipase